MNNAGLLLLVKAISMTASLLVIPLYLGFFEHNFDLLSTWLTLFVFVIICTSLDFGLGSRLKNDLIECYAKKNDNSNELILIAFISYVLLALLLSVLLILLFFIDFFDSILLNAVKVNEFFLLFYSFIVFIVINVPLKITISVLQSVQKNALSGFLLSFPQISIFVCVLFFNSSFSSFKIFELFLWLAITCTLLNLFFFYKYVGIKFFAGFFNNFLSVLRSEHLLNTFKSSFPFFTIQICFIFLFSANEIFYKILGMTQSLVEYQYYYRPFSLFFVAFSLLSLPFWSAIRAFAVSGNLVKARKYSVSIILLNIVVIVSLIPFYYIFPFFLDFWLGEGVFTAPSLHVLMFCLFSFLMCFVQSVTAILNGFDVITNQAFAVFFTLLLKIALIFFLPLTIFEIDVVVFSTVICLLVLAVLLTLIICTSLKKFNFIEVKNV